MEQIKYGFGIDMAKEKFDVCLSTIDTAQQVTIVTQASFDNTQKGFGAFLQWSRKNTPLSLPSVFLMEATGIYYEGLAWYLYDQDCVVSVVLPNKAKKYKESLGLKSKNDKIDAQALSRMCCEQRLTTWKPFSKSIYTLRIITRQIESLCAQTTATSNQLQALQYGMFRDKSTEAMLQKQLDMYAKQKAALHQRVEQIVGADPLLKERFGKICTIKGFGLQTLAVIVAETNGFAAIESAAQLASYAGYDVVENQSGTRDGKTRISKKGNSRIRRAMHFPALNMVRYEVAGLAGLFARVYERSRIKMKAYVAVQRKLLTIVYALWKKNEMFDPAYQHPSKTSGEMEAVPSLAAAPAADTDAVVLGIQQPSNRKEITPSNTDGVTQDRHPSKPRRMPSLATVKLVI